MLFYMRFLLAK